MRWNIRIPAWVAAAGCVAVLLVLGQGIRSGVVPTLAGEDSWVVTPPAGTPRIDDRPQRLLISFCDRSTARRLAAAYWTRHLGDNAAVAIAECRISAASLEYGVNSARPFVTIVRSPPDWVCVEWYSPGAPRADGWEKFQGDAGD